MVWKRLTGGVLLFVLIFLSVGSASPPDDAGRLIDAFNRVGANPEKIVLHHGNRTRTPYPREAISTIAEQLRRDLGLGPVHRTVDRHGIRWTAVGGWGRNLQTRLTVINDRVDLSENRPYISIQLTGRGQPGMEWTRFRHRLEKILIRHGVEPRIQFSIQGSRPGQSSHPEEAVRQVLERLNAREIEGMRTDRTTSISAYAPALRGGLETSGGTMNVQVAARMDRSRGRIILTLGTPIITIEY
jgi:hypothetical protein